MNEDGYIFSIREKILIIIVKKGWKFGIKIIFLEEGDQGLNNVLGKIQLLKNLEFGDFWRILKYLYYISVLRFVYKIRIFVCS